LVENCFPADSRVRNEANTLARNGFRVTVIARFEVPARGLGIEAIRDRAGYIGVCW
jgi:hypothetical protein